MSDLSIGAKALWHATPNEMGRPATVVGQAVYTAGEHKGQFRGWVFCWDTSPERFYWDRKTRLTFEREGTQDEIIEVSKLRQKLRSNPNYKNNFDRGFWV